MVGESSREVEYPFSVEETMSDLQTALGSIGKVLEVSPALKTIVGRCRYGLQAVKLRISVVDTGRGSSMIKIVAFGDDIWGGGARKGTDKLMKALDSIASSRS